MIGPYKIPVKFFYDSEYSPSSVEIHQCTLYKLMLDSTDVLVVFPINKHCIVCMCKDRGYEVDFNGNPDVDLPEWEFTTPMQAPALTPIGYVKTYQRNLATSTLPYKLFMDESGYFDQTHIKVLGKPLVNPPVNIYKELVNTDDNIYGMYFDTTTMSLRYIDKDGKEVQKDGRFMANDK